MKRLAALDADARARLDASAADVDGLAAKSARDAEKMDFLRDQLVEAKCASDDMERVLRAKIDELAERAVALEAQVANAAATSEVSRLREELVALEADRADHVETMERQINDLLDALRTKNDKSQRAVERAETTIVALDAAREDAEAEARALAKRSDDAAREARETERRLDAALAAVADLESALIDAERRLDDAEEAAAASSGAEAIAEGLRGQLDALATRLQSADAAVVDLEREVEEARERERASAATLEQVAKAQAVDFSEMIAKLESKLVAANELVVSIMEARVSDEGIEEGARAQLRSMAKIVAARQREVVDLTRELQTTKESLTASGDELARTKSAALELEARLAGTERELQREKELLSMELQRAITANIAASEIRLEKARILLKTAERAEATAKAYEKEIKTLKLANVDLATDAMASAADLRKRLEESEAARRRVEKKYGGVDVDGDGDIGDIGDASEERAWRAEAKALREKIADTEKTLADTSERMNDVVRDLEAKLAAAEKKARKGQLLEAAKRELEKRLNDSEALLNAERERLLREASDAREAALEEQRVVRAKLDALRESLASRDAALAEAVAASDALAAANDDIRARLARAETAVARREDVDELRGEIESLRAAAEATEAALEVREDELAEARNDARDAEKTSTSRDNKVNAMKWELLRMELRNFVPVSSARSASSSPATSLETELRLKLDVMEKEATAARREIDALVADKEILRRKLDEQSKTLASADEVERYSAEHVASLR